MLKKITIVLFILLLVGGNYLNAQTHQQDTTEDKCNNHEWFKWKWSWNWEDENPFIELNYGFGEPEQKEFYSSFAKTGIAEIKLGFNSTDKIHGENILEINERFIFGSRISSDIYSTNNDTKEVKTNLFRIGFAKRNGYGYDLGRVSILPYHETGFVWSQFDIDRSNYPDRLIPPESSYFPPEVLNDSQILDRYNKQTRFGTLAEAGVRLDISSFVSFNAAYESAVIFPRHLFWKQSGSFILESIGSSSLDYFINEILDSTPAAAPVVNFVLKNAYSYGWHLLKKDKMNWPFNTETPFTYEIFKVGITLTF